MKSEIASSQDWDGDKESSAVAFRQPRLDQRIPDMKWRVEPSSDFYPPVKIGKRELSRLVLMRTGEPIETAVPLTVCERIALARHREGKP